MGKRSAGLVLTLVGLAGLPAAAANYEFVEIFRSTADLSLYPLSASLDDRGDVVFIADDSGNVSRLYRALSGQAPEPLTEVSLLGSPRTRVDNAGTIAWVSQEASGTAIRRLGTGPAIALDTSGPIASISPGFDMNEAGEIAAHVTFDNGDEGVVVTHDGSIVTVFAEPDADVSIDSSPALNDAGQVAFRVLVEATQLDTIYRGSSAPPTRVLDALTKPFDCNPAQNGCFGSRVDLDDAGRVLVNGYFAAAGPLLEEGYFIQGETLTTVADTTMGHFALLRGPGVLNARGDVVFTAQEKASGVYGYAYYTGPDPVADRLIGPGDALLGSKVASLIPGYLLALNEAGQVLFSVLLENGATVLVRADPVPEPGGTALGATSVLALAVLVKAPLACGSLRGKRATRAGRSTS